MAGYYIYSLDGGVFLQLTTSPTREQGLVLADFLLEGLDDLLEDFDDESEAAMWPRDREALAALIVKRLASPDWYSDLSFDNVRVWDEILFSLQDEPGDAIGIDFQCSDYESIYWDCAEIAAKKGATIMAEPAFGNSGFRYFGKPSSEYTLYPMYTFHLPDQTKKLLAELEKVEPHFASLPDGEGSPREQFFEGLLPAVRDAAAKGRVLWVQTDT